MAKSLGRYVSAASRRSGRPSIRGSWPKPSEVRFGSINGHVQLVRSGPEIALRRIVRSASLRAPRQFSFRNAGGGGLAYGSGIMDAHLCPRHPTGKSVFATKTCPALPQKIFRFRRRANQVYELAPSFPGKRGVSRSSRTRGGMRWTRQRRREAATQGRVILVSGQPARGRTALVAYGKTVWSRHPLLVPSCRWRI